MCVCACVCACGATHPLVASGVTELIIALAIFVAIFFSINAWFFAKHLSKINRNKCLRIWESKVYLAINVSAPGLFITLKEQVAVLVVRCY